MIKKGRKKRKARKALAVEALASAHSQQSNVIQFPAKGLLTQPQYGVDMKHFKPRPSGPSGPLPWATLGA